LSVGVIVTSFTVSPWVVARPPAVRVGALGGIDALEARRPTPAPSAQDASEAKDSKRTPAT